MFEKLAKFRLVKPRRMTPHWLEAVHSNDNTPGRRRAAGRLPSPRPMLACHWVFIDESRLECRWRVESFDETSVEDPGPRRPSHNNQKIAAQAGQLFESRTISLSCVARTSLDDAI
jgi:hypothetical protein